MLKQYLRNAADVSLNFYKTILALALAVYVAQEFWRQQRRQKKELE